jgi:hypothetical protein
MNIIDVYRQYGIRYVEHGSGDRHSTRDNVNCRCPFCSGSPGNHLGYHLTKGVFYCWRCGYHPRVETLAALCHVTDRVARDLAYQLWQGKGSARRADTASKHIRIEKYRRPSDVWRLRPSHRRYLVTRGFDPDEIAANWFVASTGPVATLARIDYSHRLFIPILWDDREVSFQTRDVTDKSERKYMACPPAYEAVHHKSILYGRPDCWSRTGIAVEGVTDAWRLGTSAFATFGTGYKEEQVSLIRKLFDRVVIVFDGEREAQKQAQRLRGSLCAADLQCEVYKLGRGQDPGSLSPDDAAHLVAEIRRWR